VLSIVAVGSIVYAIIEGPASGWLSATTVTAFTFGSATTAVFLVWEMRREAPMLDLRLFRNPSFSAASVALAMLFFAMAGAVFLQAQYLQFILGYTPLAAGFALVPAALGMIVGTGAGAHLAAQHGGRIAVITGTLFAAAGLAVQAGFIDGTSYAPTGIGLFLFGLGAGIAMAPATALIMATLPPARAGVGSAVNDTVRELGGALGVAIIGSIAATRYSTSMRADLAGIPTLPDPMRSAVTDNIGAALTTSRGMTANAMEIEALARHAFIDSMTGALWVAVGAAVLATLIAFVVLPRPNHASAADRDPAPGHHEPLRMHSHGRTQ
jgi:predicted MFS family arabinose efflux permease